MDNFSRMVHLHKFFTKMFRIAIILYVLSMVSCQNIEKLSACFQLREIKTREAQALGTEGIKIFIPVCKQNGDFEDIQCDSFLERCWCVNRSGLEIPGTRASDRNHVNCKAPAKCSRSFCRMFCEDGFELDANGCPICKCYDPCQNINCPNKQSCHVEKIPCSEEKCPSIGNCRASRRLDPLCSEGSPLYYPSNKPFICTNNSNGVRCPSGYKCNIVLDNNFGVCCPSKEVEVRDKLKECVLTYTGKCGKKCVKDNDCEGNKRCCQTETCGKMCAASQNSSLCFQQVAALKSLKTVKTSLWLPRCRDDGNFEYKQCLPDNKLCWCVNNDGIQLGKAFTPKELYNCGKNGKTSPKPGICPYDDEISCDNESCTSDEDCEGNKKCCKSLHCGFKCVSALPKPPKIPTICEHLRNIGMQLIANNRSLAIPVPQCLPDGKYSPRQCDTKDNCWCVNTFGVKITGSEHKFKDPVSCREARSMDKCDGRICRLGCPFGFETDKDGCEICECRDPCQDVKCSTHHVCKLIEVQCDYGWCPKVPMCEPIPSNLCPYGSPFFRGNSSQLVTCDPYVELGKPSECPNSHKCIKNEEFSGVCCLNGQITRNTRNQLVIAKIGSCPPVLPWEAGLCINQCLYDNECPGYQKCCLNGCGKYMCKDPEGFTSKIGQCPYNVSSNSENCDFQCKNDYQCKGDSKCCSNGCGTQCMNPIKMKACEHQREVTIQRVRQMGLKPNEVYIPTCQADGTYDRIQCNPVREHCWCVDNYGVRIPGIKPRPASEIDCKNVDTCPSIKCNLTCPVGFKHDNAGCPICACENPCENIKCKSPLEECRAVKVKCITEPCPPLALCLPRLENPCPIGRPLEKYSGNIIPCGPSGNTCPSSHRCHMSPLGEYSVCCPKTRSDCMTAKSYGSCNSTLDRWYFDKDKNTCERFVYGGCGGNLNNFESKEHCEATCPVYSVLTSCEEYKEKSLANKNESDITFIPKCNKKTGEWDLVQCIESLGLCWCVNNKGMKIPGTAVRGLPHCHKRKARKLDDVPLCPEGEPAHICPKNLCYNKMCFAHPKAICRINPCGGCHIEFYSETNEKVNCNEGLSACYSEVQEVINSPAWSRQDTPLSEVAHMLPKDFRINSNQFTTIINRELQAKQSVETPSRPRISHVTLDIGLLGSKLTFHTDGKQNKQQFSRKQDYNEQHLPQRSSLKIGSCPDSGEMKSMLEGLITGCSTSCSVDTDCPGTDKCCLSACGLTCHKAVIRSDEAQSMSKSLVIKPPKCSSEGGYSIVQRQGEFSWCVDKFGKPLENTLTRGEIKCNMDGTIKERKEIGPVCLSSNKVPKVCKDECLKAFCHQHPLAICKADPCNDCAISFYNSRGEKVNCLDKCIQPIERGTCHKSYKRYFFNPIRNRCEHFTYTGCGGNDNNYKSKEECEKACQNPVPVCDQPKDSGNCKNFVHRWYYNKYTHNCESFQYGGCGGNNNNFETKELCEARCPDSVLCPWGQVTDHMKVCSRYKSCVETSCPANPKAMCTVDPCTCEPYFVDAHGKFVACDFSLRGPLQLVAPAVTKETRCQNARRKHLSEASPYVAQCDKDGNFKPKQCSSNLQGLAKCWCVDEFGRPVQDSSTLRSDGSCEFVKVDHVDVELSFKHNSTSYAENKKVFIKNAVENFLHNISADTGEVALKILPNNTVIVFTLKGDNKEQIAYQLEKMVKNGNMALHSKSDVLPVDVSASHFHHVSESAPSKFYEYENTKLKDLGENGSAVTAIAIVSVVGAVLLILIIATLLYRKQRCNYVPQNYSEDCSSESRKNFLQYLLNKFNLQNRNTNVVTSISSSQARHIEDRSQTAVQTNSVSKQEPL
ncbi:uncharacterized protein LOC111627489 [Centruroides sculpturatus]|uniref:uncharacterized protein LOC111627489 n=1 Tax=Centruroides sculpturatus TaxID=218467 RepID=UPI000C6EFBD7|nr:uncharacterized protein LOC111627489 [Centruroides sculpturatus]